MLHKNLTKINIKYNKGLYMMKLLKKVQGKKGLQKNQWKSN